MTQKRTSKTIRSNEKEHVVEKMKIEIHKGISGQVNHASTEFPGYIQAKMFREYKEMKDSIEYSCFFQSKLDPDKFSKVRIDLELSGETLMGFGFITEEEFNHRWMKVVVEKEEEVYQKVFELAFEEYIEYLVDVQMVVRASSINISKTGLQDMCPIVTKESLFEGLEKLDLIRPMIYPYDKYVKTTEDIIKSKVKEYEESLRLLYKDGVPDEA